MNDLSIGTTMDDLLKEGLDQNLLEEKLRVDEASEQIYSRNNGSHSPAKRLSRKEDKLLKETKIADQENDSGPTKLQEVHPGEIYLEKENNIKRRKDLKREKKELKAEKFYRMIHPKTEDSYEKGVRPGWHVRPRKVKMIYTNLSTIGLIDEIERETRWGEPYLLWDAVTAIQRLTGNTKTNERRYVQNKKKDEQDKGHILNMADKKENPKPKKVKAEDSPKNLRDLTSDLNGYHNYSFPHRGNLSHDVGIRETYSVTPSKLFYAPLPPLRRL